MVENYVCYYSASISDLSILKKKSIFLGSHLPNIKYELRHNSFPCTDFNISGEKLIIPQGLFSPKVRGVT